MQTFSCPGYLHAQSLSQGDVPSDSGYQDWFEHAEITPYKRVIQAILDIVRLDDSKLCVGRDNVVLVRTNIDGNRCLIFRIAGIFSAGYRSHKRTEVLLVSKMDADRLTSCRFTVTPDQANKKFNVSVEAGNVLGTDGKKIAIEGINAEVFDLGNVCWIRSKDSKKVHDERSRENDGGESQNQKKEVKKMHGLGIVFFVLLLFGGVGYVFYERSEVESLHSKCRVLEENLDDFKEKNRMLESANKRLLQVDERRKEFECFSKELIEAVREVRRNSERFEELLIKMRINDETPADRHSIDSRQNRACVTNSPTCSVTNAVSHKERQGKGLLDKFKPW